MNEQGIGVVDPLAPRPRVRRLQRIATGVLVWELHGDDAELGIAEGENVCRVPGCKR